MPRVRCPYCKNPLAEGAEFCPRCDSFIGKIRGPTGTGKEDDRIERRANSPEPYVKYAPKISRSGKYAAVAICIGLIFLLLVGTGIITNIAGYRIPNPFYSILPSSQNKPINSESNPLNISVLWNAYFQNQSIESRAIANVHYANRTAYVTGSISPFGPPSISEPFFGTLSIVLGSSSPTISGADESAYFYWQTSSQVSHLLNGEVIIAECQIRGVGSSNELILENCNLISASQQNTTTAD